MDKIIIFYGSDEEFNKIIPIEARSFTDVINEIDENHRTVARSWGDEVPEAENLVIHSSEYLGVREHVIINFANFIGEVDVQNMYIQNPPLCISEQLHRIYDKQGIISENHQTYNEITKDIIRQFYREYDDHVIGQKTAKMEILQALYPLMNKRQKKPVVILFYGDSGIGKTETAHYLAKLLDGKPMRKQFSMYQNSDFAMYLFGGNHEKSSFARDLLGRDSNVILLDEFDKANTFAYSAFYQLFDEGVFEDQNYKVNLEYAVIICTSNFKTKSEAKAQLGAPIFNRFDAVIHFEDLSREAKTRIAADYYQEISEKYKEENIELDEETLSCLQKATVELSNAREIKRLIQDTFSYLAIRKLCLEDIDQCRLAKDI